MELVDEKNEVGIGCGFLDDHLHSLLEIASVTGTCDNGRNVQRNQPFLRQCRRNAAGGYPDGYSLYDGGFSDTRLADQHRIVLLPSAQDLDDACNLGIPADDRVQTTFGRSPGEVRAEIGDADRVVPGLSFRALAFLRALFRRARSSRFLTAGRNHPRIMQGREYLPIVNPLVMKIGLTETFGRMA